MIRVYSRRPERVRTVKRQEPPTGSNNRKGRRDLGADKVLLGTKEISGEQIFGLLQERIAHHLARELGGVRVELGFEQEVSWPHVEPFRALARSVLGFARAQLGRFKEGYPLLEDDEARLQLATLIVAVVERATEEVLHLVGEASALMDEGVLADIRRFHEAVSYGLGEFVETSPVSELS